MMTNKVPNIVQKWADSISKRNAKNQTLFYSKQALLLATYEPILIGQKEIYKYFVDLLSSYNSGHSKVPNVLLREDCS